MNKPYYTILMGVIWKKTTNLLCAVLFRLQIK